MIGCEFQFLYDKTDYSVILYASNQIQSYDKDFRSGSDNQTNVWSDSVKINVIILTVI